MQTGIAHPLPEAERLRLLSLARQAIIRALRRESLSRSISDSHTPPPDSSPSGSSSAGISSAGGPGGIFVSVHCQGRLRGCIGVLEPREPTEEAVMRCAVAAATADERFDPLALHELPGCEIEISVLASPRRITDPARIEPGVHGLIITEGARRGLLLPRVATDNGWDRETFLAQACRKAGLPPDAWRSGALIEVFEAERFSDGELEVGLGQP